MPEPAIERANRRWGGGGILVDQHGNRFMKIDVAQGPANDAAGGGDGGSSSILSTDAIRDIPLLKGGVAILFGLLATFFWFFLDRIDSRFDRVDQPVRVIESTMAGHTATLASVNEKLERIMDKLDEDPKPQTTPLAAQGKN
jgi:hypothetical protein